MSAGFRIEPEGTCLVGGVALRFAGADAGRGIVGWSLTGLPEAAGPEMDGIPTTAAVMEPAATEPGATAPAGDHPNGVRGVDHVVLLSPDVDRTMAALAEIGAAPRRERQGDLGGAAVRQVFFRLGEVIVELVGAPGASGDGPAELWGVTFVVSDIDAAAAFLGAGASAVKAAVQPGRRITTLRHRDFGITTRIALISPLAPRP